MEKFCLPGKVVKSMPNTYKTEIMKNLLLCACMFLMATTAGAQQIVNFAQLAKADQPAAKGVFTKGMQPLPKPAPVTVKTNNSQTIPGAGSAQERAAETTPAANTIFTGVIGNDNVIPLNPGVAANDSFIMEVSNQQYTIYNRQGTSLMTLNQSSFYGIATGVPGVYDPKILYETKLNRWLVSTGISGYGVTLAVSLTSNPTGSWYIYHAAGIDSSIGFNDYPCMGYSDSLIVISANDYINYYGKTSQPNYVYNSFFVINKYDALKGILKYTNVIDTNKNCLYPAQNFDGTDTVWNVEYLESYEGYAYYYVSCFTGGSKPVYHPAQLYSYDIGGNYTTYDYAPQMGISDDIYTGDGRVQPTPSVRNGQLLFCHEMSGPTAGTPTYDYVQWLQIWPHNGTLIQQGQINDTKGLTTYFFPSITSDSKGDILLGYNVTSASNYISAAYSYHLSTDAPGFMSPTYIYDPGVSPYYVTLGTINRWGDNNMIGYDVSTDGFVGIMEISNDTNAAGQKIWQNLEYGDSRGAIFTYSANVIKTPPVTCATPSGLETVNVTANGATLVWPNNTSATSYQCYCNYYGQTLKAYSGTVHRGSVNDSMTLQNLPSYAEMQWSVKAQCGTASSSMANTATFTTLSTPCGTPTLSVRTVTATSATIALVPSGTQGESQSSTPVLKDLVYSPYSTIAWDTVVTSTGKIKNLKACTEYYVYEYITCQNASYWFEQPITFTTRCTSDEEVTTDVADLDSISFNVYPNPAGDYTMIAFNPTATGSTLKVFDLSGRQLMADERLTASPQRIQLSQLPVGMYMLSIENENQHAVKMLVKTE